MITCGLKSRQKMACKSEETEKTEELSDVCIFLNILTRLKIMYINMQILYFLLIGKCRYFSLMRSQLILPGTSLHFNSFGSCTHKQS